MTDMLVTENQGLLSKGTQFYDICNKKAMFIQLRARTAT